MEGSSVENPIVLNEEEDKENAALSTPVSERPTEPPRLLRSRAFGAGIENVHDFVYRNLFQYLIPCLCFDIYIIINVFHFYHNFFQKLVRHV